MRIVLFYTINWQNENKKLLYSDFLEKYLRNIQQNVNENNTSFRRQGLKCLLFFVVVHVGTHVSMWPGCL